MVLGITTAQYAFLQTLASTYVWMLADLQSAGCIVNPQIYTDCTDLSQWYNQNIPYFPESGQFYAKNDPDTFNYNDYSSVTWHGWNPTVFQANQQNLTTAAISFLYAACGTNSTCTTAYNNTPQADAVITALVQTNMNTISSLLTKNSKKYYFSNMNWAVFSLLYQNTPSTGDEIYGLHEGVLQGVAIGNVNASAYLQQQALGQLLYGGAQVWESMVHVAAIGSWSVDSVKQSNINLTAPQLFHKISTSGGLDTRSTQIRSQPRAVYNTKWQVWLDESKGVIVPNKGEIFEEIKQRWRNATMSISRSVGSPQICTPPDDLSDGLNWLSSLVNTGCNIEGYASAGSTLFKAVDSAIAATVEKGIAAWGTAGRTGAGVWMSQIISGCTSDDVPCYPGADVWTDAVAAGTIAQTAAQLFIDAAEFSTPVGAAFGLADLFCGVAPAALQYYQQASQCCQADCNSPGCQAAINGCSAGTGTC